VQIARKVNPRLYIIVRTRYTAEVEDLIKLGANEVIPEEFETSIELFTKVLHHYQIPRNLIMDQIEKIRKGSYEVLRRVELPIKSLPEKCEIISDFDIETYLIDEHTNASGRSIKDLKIHSEIEATLIAVRRGEEVIPNPGPEFIFKPGDVLYLIGKREKVCQVIELLESRPE
jgi:CPA2 family monovalent cation:H+ antiporter-2